MAVDVNELARRYEALRTERNGWDAAWRSLAELFLPCRWRSDTDTTAHQSPKLNGRLVNSAGVLAMRTLAAGMQGGMTSPVRPWFRLTTKGDDIAGMPGLNAWLEEVTSRMQRVLHESNFYNAVHGLYADLGTFGTGLLIETADEDGIHFHLIRAGEYVLDVNGRNEVDTFFRRLNMTARQIVDRWGEDRVPDAVRNVAKRETGQGGVVRFDVIHGVFPRRDARGGLGGENKPFASVYWLQAAGGSGKPCILSEGGFDSFPAYAPRWDVNGADVYGRSPAMDVTPDCRMLQAMTATLRKMQHKIADPPLAADSSIKAFGVDITPGALNFVDMGRLTSAGAPIVPIQQPEPQALNYTMQGIQGVEKVINDGLYVDLFRMLIDDDRRQITATEIQAKQQEKMILIGPVVERLHKELLEPLIIRTYMLMGQYGVLPPMPDGMHYAELDVAFESVLAQAQKLTATSSIDQGMAFVVNAAQVAPDALDMLDTDSMVKSYLDRVGMPEGCLRDEQTVRQIRQQKARAQAAAQQQEEAALATQQAVDMTAAAKNLGQTPVGADGQTLMGAILGGLGAV